MGVITVDACAGYAYAAGFRGEPLVTIVAIAGPESGYDTTQHNTNANSGDNSYGLWQINMLGTLGPARRKQFALSSNDQLFDPATNARAAWGISAGGTKFTDWTTYKNGKHRAYLDAARAAAKSVEARSGAAVAAGASPLEASTPGPIAGERLPPGGGLADNGRVLTVFPTLSVVGGGAAVEPSARMGISGSVALSVSAVTEVTLVFADPRGPVQSQQVWYVQTEAKMGDLHLIVTNSAWGEQDGIETLTVTLQALGAVKMRQPEDSGASAMWSNLSPTEVLAERAGVAGLRFYGKGSPQRTQITRLGADDAGRDYAESDWELGQRFAKEEGFWFFEAAGALYFAPPSWLRDHGTRFPVQRRATGPQFAWGTLGIPEAETTIEEVPSHGLARHLTRTMTLPLPRARGEQVRPGMVVDFTGIPGYEGATDGLAAHAGFVVTDVGWALDGGATPASIQVTDARDPVPEPPTDDVGALNDSATGPTTAAASSFPSGTGVSNQGKGTYGLQYDPVGDTPATGEQPGARVLMNHLTAKFTSSQDSGIFNPRNVDGTGKLSVHAEGRAGDSGVPTRSVYGDGLANYLVANASLFGIQYVIWNGRSWISKTSTWKSYTPPNGKTDDTSFHRNHVHWELCWEAARYLNAAAIRGAYSG